MHITSRLLSFCMAVIFSVTSLFARDFVLGNPRTSTVFGPYRFVTGARGRLGGVPYEIVVHKDGRFSFKSLSDGKTFGPFQAVDNRLVNIDSEMYCFNWNAADARNALVSQKKSAAERAYEADSRPVKVADLPPEPAKPTRLEAPEEQPARSVSPKNLTDLPDPAEFCMVYAWLAFLDRTAVDWKINSKKGKQSDIERISLGSDLSWNCWIAQLSLSPSVKTGEIVPTNDGNANIDSGTGWSLALGYNRPFLFESGWSANAGIRGMMRQDKGDMSSLSYVISSQADTNGVYTLEKTSATTSVTLTELSLWVDLGLSYSYENWGVYSDFSFQPVSEYNVSGDLSYAGEKLKLDAERANPIAIQIGGWYQYDIYRFFIDMTFASDTQIRIGCGFQF